MDKWKYEVGDIISMGKTSRIIITGKREEECHGGTQKFYIVYQIVESYIAGVGVTSSPLVLPDIVVEQMVQLAEELKKEE